MVQFLQPAPTPRGNVVGWREWLAFPDLGISRLKAKVDTGAKTSSLHAFDIEYFEQGDRLMVRFKVHPRQRNTRRVVEANAPVLEHRNIRNSGGGVQNRPVIRTYVAMGNQRWPIELTLANRDVMGFRMLLGREAVRHRFIVDPGGSYLMSPLNLVSSSRGCR